MSTNTCIPMLYVEAIIKCLIDMLGLKLINLVVFFKWYHADFNQYLTNLAKKNIYHVINKKNEN